MKNEIFRRIVSLILTGVILLSSVPVLNALTENEVTSVDHAMNSSNEIENTSETIEIEETTSIEDAEISQEIEEYEEISVAYSTESENGEGETATVSTEVTWTGVNSNGTPGSESNPYAVSDVAHFLDMSRLINEETNALKYFRLTADLDLSSVTLTDISNSASYGLANTIVSINPTLTSMPENMFFVLDGNNKTISNFSISDNSRNSLAIFGYLNSQSVVKNIIFSNITFNSTYSSLVCLGIFLKNEGTISECSFKDINISTTSGNTDDIFAPILGDPFRIYTGVAGVIVDNQGTFTQETLLNSDLTKNITVTSTGKRTYVGGVVAQNRGYIYKTIATSVKVDASETSQYVGGYVAANLSSSESTTAGMYYVDCSLAANGVKGGNFTGALVGNNTGRINYCSVKGVNNLKNVLSRSNYDILMYGGKTYGGISAANSGIIDKCSATDIGVYYADSVANGVYGGISGENTYSIQNSVSTGFVVTSDSSINVSVGGIVGKGSDVNRFYIANCYTLVKLPKTTSDLGAIIGTQGDNLYNDNKVKNCFYSSVFCGRPSPVSYGGTGESFGDLQYNISYLALRTGTANAVTKNLSDFTYSGWGNASISLVGSVNSFYIDPSETTYISLSVLDGTVKFTPNTTGNKVQTIHYDTNITLPSGIGPVTSGNYVLSSQPLSLRTIQKTTSWVGSGTIEDPYQIQAGQLSALTYIPYGNYKLITTSSTSCTSIVNVNTAYFPESSTFWGTFDGNGLTLRTMNAKIPLFKGIYGSRDATNPQQDDENHISDPSSDTASNQKHGLVKNLTYEYYTAYTTPTSFFGNVCSATILDVNFIQSTGSSKPTFIPSESEIGVAFRTVYGNSYLYNVYNDGINVTINTSVNSIAGLIGTVDAQNAIIDNCGSNSIITVSKSGVNYCSAFIGNIKSLSGTIQNCYSSGAVKPLSTSYTLENSNYIFAAQSISSAKIYNSYYSPTDYYTSALGVFRAIPDGKYTGSLSLWSFSNPIYVVTETQSLIANTINNLNRFDMSLYDTASGRISLSDYFSSEITGTGYTCSKIYYTSGITAVVEVAEGASESAEIKLNHLATGLVAKGNIVSSSEIEIVDGYYLIQKPTDLYMITLNQAATATDNGRYLSSEYKFKLVADIDMTGFTIDSWGKSSTYPFMGSLEGINLETGESEVHTISGLNLTSLSCGGLFGYVDGATIKNVNISGATVTGGIYTGALVGQIRSNATIENCKVEQSVVTGDARVGGLIGGIYSSSSTSEPTIISDCSVENTVVNAVTIQNSSSSTPNPSMCGGVIGSVGSLAVDSETKYALISNCSLINSNVNANSYDVGGIVGIASNYDNEISNCLVNGSEIISECESISFASVGGIVGTYGGKLIDASTLNTSSVSGENASGIVSRIVNFTGPTTVSNCQLVDSDVTGISYAGGITANVGAYGTKYPYENKTITNCVVDADSNVSSKVAGGIVGVVMSSYSRKTLAVTNSNSYATVTTTGDKGSKIEGAAAIIGRLSSNLDTSNITISNCVAGGNITGSACLGGIIALLSSNEHTASTKIISDVYITATFTPKTLKAVKGLAIAYIGDNNTSNITNICQNVVFSSYGQNIEVYGNAVDSSNSTFIDLNKGADGINGITLTASDEVAEFCLVSGNGTNTITLKENLKGEYDEDVSPGNDTRFKTGNLPALDGFALTKVSNIQWASSNTNKLQLGVSAGYNSATYISFLTYEYKGRVNVYTYFENTDVNGYPVTFTVGFTVICTGTHKFDGEGTDANPYKLYDAEDVVAIKEHHDAPLENENADSFYTASYMVMNDIDMSEICLENGVYKSFPSIGTSVNPFKGNIASSGEGPFTISNLYISSEASDYAGNLVSYPELSDNYGLFGYTLDATISNLNFENVTIIGGNYAGVVAGSAENTDISNVTISGDVSIQECAAGAFVVGYSTGNLNIDTVAVSGAEISSQSTAGGIVGIAIQCDASTISNFSVSDCTIESLATSGTYYAGAVAGQINGTISGVYDEEGTLTSASTVNNCIVKAPISSGVVGSGSPNSGDNAYGLTIKGVNVVNTKVGLQSTTDEDVSSVNTAAGILGKTYESYDYLIKDCTIDSDSSCDAYNVAGGILGNASITSSLYNGSLEIDNCNSYARLNQRIVNVDEEYGNVRKTVGVGGIIGLVSSNAKLRRSVTNESLIKVRNCTAGGVLSGSMNVGGVIGQMASTDYYVYNVTEPIIKNCIITSSFDKTYSDDLRFGVVIGAVEGNISNSENDPYPDRNDYVCNPFEEIFYSSYMSKEFRLFGKSAFYNYQAIDMSESIYDINHIAWEFEDDEGNTNELPIALLTFPNSIVPAGTLPVTSDKFYFSTEFVNDMGTSLNGDIFSGFNINSTSFELDSITSSNESVFTVTIVNNQYIVNSNSYGQADLIFTYKNGLKIAINVVCGVNYDGEGTAENPILVSSEAIFAYIVPVLHNYYFLQTTNLDFSSSLYKNMKTIESFGGHYDGAGYSISNLTINSSQSENPVGIFGTVSGKKYDSENNVIANIENLVLNNCIINATDCSNVGILSGTLSDNATVSDITITNSSVSGLSTVGGLVGTIGDGCTVENSSVTASVNASYGQAGGIAAVMTSSNSLIDNCSVSDSTITTACNTAEDIAGGIVAKAVGTINGKVDENNNLLNCVENTNVTAFVAGGAVGATYFSNYTSSLTLNNIKVSSVNVTADYNSTLDTPSAAGILSRISGEGDYKSDIIINNCYVDKNSTISSKRYASGCVGYNFNSNINSITITDTEIYATVDATQKTNAKQAYVGSMIAYIIDIDANIIKMDGCVAGGKLTANAWKSYAGGAIGYVSSTQSLNTEFFVNGVLSAIVNADSVSTDTSANNENCYGKCIGGMNSATLLTDDESFLTVFHDILYSSYPQNCAFFGMNSIDSFQIIQNGTIPFEDINTGTNFTISANNTVDGPWNPIAIAKDIGTVKTFYIKFEKDSLTYANNRKTSYVDESEFIVTGEDQNGNVIFDIDSQLSEQFDVNLGTYYQFSIIPRNYGAGQIGASYDCGLATSLPILCVEINGLGTEASPYEITNPIQLYVVGYLLNSGVYFKQMNDIDLSDTYNPLGDDTQVINYNGGSGFSPIGTQSNPFKGNYDGQNYKITGLYISRKSQDYVGLFGNVLSDSSTQPATLKNIHVELLESDKESTKTNGIIGQNYVGGLVGNISGSNSVAVIDNCSVIRSTVIGENYVGGLCGQIGANVSLTRSFTESDVYSNTANSYAGGIIGVINAGLSSTTVLDKCFSSSNVFARSSTTTSTSGFSGGLVGYVANGASTVSNCLFTGSTNGGHGIFGDKSSINQTSATVSGVIDAGQNTAMYYGKFVPITTACVSSSTNITFTDTYYDKALIKVSSEGTVPDGIAPKMTSELINGTINGISADDWTYSENSYPVPKVLETDSYSLAYSKLLSIAVKTSESEEIDDADDVMYGKGLTYPVQLLQNAGSTKITYSSSIFDESDTVAYPTGYDTNLYGIMNGDSNNKNTDLLFEDINDTSNVNYGFTSVYRNIFAEDNGSNEEHSTNLTGGACLDNGEVMYNLQIPVVYANVTIDGNECYREIKIPLSYDNLYNTYCIATQRQLFALGLAEYELSEPNSKFAGYYGSNYNYKLITDIVIDENNTTNFVPIGINEDGGYIGSFDGANHTISNLKIEVTTDKPAGMFSVAGSEAEIKNLNLVNAQVKGTNYVGTLVGKVEDLVTIDNCVATGDDANVVASGSYVGGLIGSVEYNDSTVSNCNASVNVEGMKDSIGGLIGKSSAVVTSCYATGNVFTEKLTQTGGVGGLIGYMVKGKVSDCFASGTVTVNDYSNIKGESITYGVGGFVGIADIDTTNSESGISSCFSGGNVKFGENVTGVINPSGSATAIVGVGGFSGVNYTTITNCYSSASVNAFFNSVKNQASGATYGVGIGGVCGVALANVENVYSSGSASKPSISDFDDTLGNAYFGVGGAVGTVMGNEDVSVSNCFFDSWKNTDATMTAIGDKENTDNCKSYTTKQLTSGTPLNGFDTNVWGFTTSAYPYINGMLNESVSPEIKTNAILSVVVVSYDEEDYSVLQGNGLTMALTVPTTFTYIDSNNNNEVNYELIWDSDSGVTIDNNKATIKRTKNIGEIMVLTVQVKDFEQYGIRQYEHLCADMRGTYEQPYLIGNVDDYQHINMTAEEHETTKDIYNDFYDQWATPTEYNEELKVEQPVQGTVYYQLTTNIDVTDVTREFTDLTNVVYVYGEDTYVYDGFVLTGNNYSIKGAHSNGAYFKMLDSKSKLSNIIFDDINLNSNGNRALVGTNNGEIYDVFVKGTVVSDETSINAGIATINNGLIDGCVADVNMTNVYDNTASLVYENNGTITNSGTSGTIQIVDTDPSNIGAFCAVNKGTITNSFAMVDINGVGGGIAECVSGFTGKNEGGTINGCFTRSSIEFDEAINNSSTVAILVGKTLNSGENRGQITNCFTAGNLGAYVSTQHSIAFASVENSDISEIYVDKSMAGKTSYNSFKYSASTQQIIKMTNMASSMDEVFTKDENEKCYPQITSVLLAENTKRLNENDEVIVLPTGTIVRNYNIIKEYANVANATLETGNSQYVDAMTVNSNNFSVNSTVSSKENILWKTSTSEFINIASGTLSTTSKAGTTILSAYKEITSARGVNFVPTMNIKVVTATGNCNPNFRSGYGTEDRPYIIDSISSLQSLYFYGSNPNLYFEFYSNIDAKGYTFEQIPMFTGKLNHSLNESENKYVVYNLDLVIGGLIEKISNGAYVGNMGVVGANLTTDSDTTGILADNIVGATVENVVATGEITGNRNVGMLAGNVTDSTVSGIVTSGYVKGADMVGGVFASVSSSNVSDVLSTAYVDGLTNVGGFAGEIRNNSVVDDIIFGGMSKGNAITVTLDDTSTLTDYYADSQLNISQYLVGEDVSENSLKTSKKLTKEITGIDNLAIREGKYLTPANLVLGEPNAKNSMFIAAIDLASATLGFRSGIGNGTVHVYTTMSFNDTVTGYTVGGSLYDNPIKGEEVVYENNANNDYLIVEYDIENGILRVNVNKFDSSVKYTALKLYVDTNNNNTTIFNSTQANRIFRYVTPGMVKTVNISYTLTDKTEILSGKTVGILLRSLNDQVGTSVDNINIFDKVSSTPEIVDSISVSAEINGFYVDDMLPQGYKYEITATDGDGNKLTVAEDENQKGLFVDLDNSTDSSVILSISIVENEDIPWGVRSIYNSIWN